MTGETGCERRGKFFGGCKFEPRYDEPVLSEQEKMFGRTGSWERLDGTNSVVWKEPPIGERTYVHDICIRCGKTAVRPPPPTPKEPA